jgi:hypothetical protein
LYSTRTPAHSSGVDEKRSKCSRSILTTWSASGDRALVVAPSRRRLPDDVRAGVVVQDRPRSRAPPRRRQTGSGSYSTSTSSGRVARQLARGRDDCCDRLADVAHACDGERVVLDVAPGLDRQLEERVGEDRDLVAVSVPYTPPSSSAFETSIDTIFACAYGERTKWT